MYFEFHKPIQSSNILILVEQKCTQPLYSFASFKNKLKKLTCLEMLYYYTFENIAYLHKMKLVEILIYFTKHLIPTSL